MNVNADTLVQAFILFMSVLVLYLLQSLPKRFISNFRRRNRSTVQAKRHFVAGAQILAHARAATTRSATVSLVKDAIKEADKAIELDPKDAASYILKSLALDLQDRKVSAIKSLDVALSFPAVQSLSDRERGDALYKRAELHLQMNRRRVDVGIADLELSVKYNPENSKAFYLLADCYEKKSLMEEAIKAYESVIKIDESSEMANKAKTALERLALPGEGLN